MVDSPKSELPLLTAASVLFTGCSYTELEDWATTMHLKMIGSTTFYDIQKAYLLLVINAEYEEGRTAILGRLSWICSGSHCVHCDMLRESQMSGMDTVTPWLQCKVDKLHHEMIHKQADAF